MADGPVLTDDQLKMKYGFWVVMFGLLVVLIIFIIAAILWRNSVSDLTAAIGSVTGIIGTVVGAYFGVQVGSAGKEKAESERSIAEKKVEHLASALQPDVAERILRNIS